MTGTILDRASHLVGCRGEDFACGAVEVVLFKKTTRLCGHHRRMRRGGRGGLQPPPQLLGNSVFWAAAVLFLGSSNGGRGVFFNFPEGGWRHADNVQGGGGACECPRVGVFLNFPEGEWRHADNVQGGEVLVKSPPPSGNPVICVKFWAVNPSAPPNQSGPIRLWWSPLPSDGC